jgi:hypothetical protein
MPPTGLSWGKVAHGSVLSDNFGSCRVNSQWQLTDKQIHRSTRHSDLAPAFAYSGPDRYPDWYPSGKCAISGFFGQPVQRHEFIDAIYLVHSVSGLP